MNEEKYIEMLENETEIKLMIEQVGYTEFYRYYQEKDKEIERLNNIINELEKRSEMLFKLEEFLQNKWERPAIQIYIGDVIKELENLGFYKIKRIKGAK